LRSSFSFEIKEKKFLFEIKESKQLQVGVWILLGFPQGCGKLALILCANNKIYVAKGQEGV
jgi:hypothetical protein